MKKWVFASATAVALLLTTPWLYAAPDLTERTRQQAEQGHADAQRNLGAMYYYGDGVRQDYTLARQWFEKAANQGDAAAQTFLGLMYHIGNGVREDYTQARQWYEKAAKDGLK